MSLYQRGKSWYYDFQSRGERYTGTIGPVSKTVAKEVLARKKAEVAEGRYAAPEKKPSPRLHDFIEEYFAYYRTTSRPRSVIRHETSWHAVRPVLGGKKLEEISPFDLERYRRGRKQEGRSDVTINRDLAFLRHVFSMAMTWGRATTNPVKQVRFARENTGRVRMLSREEEIRLLAHCGPQLTPLVLATLHTGFRASELTSLTWREVDFRRRLLTVQAAYAKNGESRSVPMNQQLLPVMRALKASASDPEAGAVFLSSLGTPYRSFRSAFEHAVQKAGIDDFTFHDLRHTFASRLVMAGVDLPTVKELMGHKTIAMTLKYTHLQTDHKENAVRLLETCAVPSPVDFHNMGESRDRGKSLGA